MSNSSPEQRLYTPAPVELPENAEVLRQERMGASLAKLGDGLLPGQDKLTREKIQEMRQKIKGGHALDNTKSTNSAMHESYKFWNGEDQNYDDLSSVEKKAKFDQNLQRWISFADEIFSQIGKDDRQKGLFKKLGISLEGDKAAENYYKDFFVSKNDHIGNLQHVIAESGMTADDFRLAQKKFDIKIKDIKTGEEQVKSVSVWEILGGFHGISAVDMEDRAAGVLNFKNCGDDFDEEAIKQFDAMSEEDKSSIQKILDQSALWERKKGIWAKKRQDEDAAAEAERQKQAEAERQAEAARKQAEEEAEEERKRKEAEAEAERLKQTQQADEITAENIGEVKKQLYDYASSNEDIVTNWGLFRDKIKKIEDESGFQKIKHEDGKLLVPVSEDSTKTHDYIITTNDQPYKIDKRDGEHGDIIVVDIGKCTDTEVFKSFLESNQFFTRSTTDKPVQIVQVGATADGKPENSEIMRIMVLLKYTFPKLISLNI